MVNEDIITALKNAVEKGESLQLAVDTLINSGYNPREVEEASHFVGAGTIRVLETRPEEHLVMPSEKASFSNQPITLSQEKQTTNLQQSFRNDSSRIKQEVSQGLEQKNQQNQSLSQELNKMSPKKNYLVEIILLILLLILMGILISSFIFREKILEFFSTLG